jgi:hypothetical protein
MVINIDHNVKREEAGTSPELGAEVVAGAAT